MEKLVKGIHGFKAGYFAENRALFEQLARDGQTPETLFVTCSDSRVVPNLITSASPGELFVLRNVGNVIPRQDLPGGTLAAVEYAVEVLEVEQIIVCGHTQCGAMDAVLHPERTAELPFVSLWLSQTERVREVICERYGHLDAAARLTAAAEENVLAQLENLADIPFVARRLADGRLRLSGWVFDIATGEVHVYDPLADEFLPLGSP